MKPLVGEGVATSEVRPGERVSWLSGRCSHLELGEDALEGWLPALVEALAAGNGTRVVLQLQRRKPTRRTLRVRSALEAAGFSVVRSSDLRKGGATAELATRERRAVLSNPSEWWAAGERRSPRPEAALDLTAAEAAMDPRDQGLVADDLEGKRMRQFLPVPHDPERWKETGLPDWIETMMQSGVRIVPEVEPPFADHPFYRWESDEARLRAIWEADRHLSVGALEYIPDSEVAEVAARCIVHPWVVAPQGEKWRLCHDYSIGTNKYVATSPFQLPSPWDVRPCLKRGSRFAKYDIRDGFFHIPVEEESRNRLVVRHPGTGRLMRARRLPFGYVESPRLFCGVMEAIADKLRRKVAGKGIHYFVFVDDWLVVGDDEERTREGCRILEAELAERGIEWAPHKQRGPSAAMEFLGLLLANLDGEMSISLTRKRRDGLLRELERWELWRRECACSAVEPRAAPRELASLLGKLVFASQVVWNGRTFMQSMLSSFAGCVVDWRRGSVSFGDGRSSSSMPLPDGFWADVRWWRQHLEERYSVRWEESSPSEAAVVGTDASGWGTGQLAWLDGGREEIVLEFTRAERRRPINWRELLGILRAVEHFGPRLEGRSILVETDNMAAKGSSARRSSKAPDMQELVRRLVDACERHRIRLRLTHTPGAQLDRPDQTSRGEPVEEPRQRVCGPLFAALERAWGPFGSFIGPEREHSAPAPPAGGRTPVAWFHPTSGSVGSTLRILHERAVQARNEGNTYRALALVPTADFASWSPLARHLGVVGRIAEGSRVLEEYGAGRWHTVPARRELTLLAYPRTAGSACVPVVLLGSGVAVETQRLKLELAGDDEWGWSSTGIEGDESLYRVLPVGSFVYYPDEAGGRGTLARVAASFDPASAVDGDTALSVVPALYYDSAKERKRRGGEVFDVDRRAGPLSKESEGYWVVSHLVKQIPPTDLVNQSPRESESEFAARAASLPYLRFSFDWRVASGEIRRRQDDAVGASDVSPGSSSWLMVDALQQTEPGGGEPAWLATAEAELQIGGAVEAGARRASSVVELVAELGRAQERHQEALLDEARRPSPPSPSDALSSMVQQMSIDGGAPLAGRAPVGGAKPRAPPHYPGVMCSACGEPVGAAGTTCLGHVVHRRASCITAVTERERLREKARNLGSVPLSQQRPDRPVAGIRPKPAQKVGAATSKEARAADQYGDQRIHAITECLEGRCDAASCKFAKTPCTHCTRGLHVAECGSFGSARASMGVLKCGFCRSEEMAPGRGRNENRLRSGMETMVLQLQLGAESTAKATADFNRLEQEFVLSRDMAGEEALLPRHGKESFMAWLVWGHREADRAQSMESLFRHLPTIFQTWELTDLTKAPEIKRLFKKLQTTEASTPTPKTAATRKMLGCLLEDIIPEMQAGNPKIMKRERLTYGTEGMTGLRIGELMDWGHAHGVSANNVRIVTIDTAAREAGMPSTFVDIFVETSKTGNPRYTGCVGTSASGVSVARYLREYWAEFGVPLIVEKRGSFTVEQPDFFVVRVNLMGLRMPQKGAEGEPAGRMVDLIGALSVCGETVRKHLGTTTRRMRERVAASGPGSEGKKWVNVCFGRESDVELKKVCDLLSSRGFESRVVEGPFITSTAGYGKHSKATPMPLLSASIYGNTKEYLIKAALMANAEELDPDFDYPTSEIESMLWGTHSLRRLFDTVALEYAEDHGLDKEKVQAMAGWREAERAKDMSTHYDENQLRKRVKAYMVTANM